MLRNERYRGLVVWNRTHKLRSPETGQKVVRRRAQHEHVRAEHPNLRIISEELWNKVQARIRQINEHGGFRRLGGMNRTAQSRTYIFSGKLQYGCGANMVIGGGTGHTRSTSAQARVIGAFAQTSFTYAVTGWKNSYWMLLQLIFVGRNCWSMP